MDTTLQKTKIGIITSRGGHLFQLIQAQSTWRKFTHFWVTLPGSDVDSLLRGERVLYAYGPESRNILNAFKNFFLAIKIMRKERPNILISSGAGIAPPFFLAAKFFGIKLIYIEPLDFIKFPTLTGKIIYPFVDIFFIQNKLQATFYKKSVFLGSLL